MFFKNASLLPIYKFFGGFAETITVVGLTAGIILAFLRHLTADYAGMITAVGGTAIAHDQLSQWNNRCDRGENDHSHDHHDDK